MRGRLSSSAFGLFLGVITVALSACGSATASNGALASDPTATAAATATVASLPTVDRTSLPASCRDIPYGTDPAYLPLVHVGDLVVSQAVYAQRYPAWQIPQGTPNRPLALSSPMANPNPGSLPINTLKTDTDGGLVFTICNTSSSRSYTVQPISVRLASFTPFTGALVAWNPCEDLTYDAQMQALGPGGCGGGYGVNEYVHATFAADAAVGATVKASQSSTSPAGPNDPNPFPGLPLSLAPGHSVSVSVVVTVPTAPGTYAFAFGLATGSAAPVYFSTSSPTLFAPITTHWSGQNCMTAAMKAQIPAATQPTYYICPPAQ